MPKVKLPKYVVEKKGYFYFRRTFYDSTGKRRERHSPLPDPFSAEFEAAYAAALGGTAGPQPGTVAAMIRAYQHSPEWTALARETLSGYRRALKRFGEVFGEFEPSQVELKHIIAWRDTMRETPAQANACVSRARELFSWGRPRGHCSHNPTEGAPRLKEKAEGHPWPVEAVKRAVTEFAPHIAAAVALGYYTGQRKSDLIDMTPDQIDGAHWSFTTRKTQIDVVVALSPPAMLILEALWPKDGAEFLRTARGTPWPKDGRSFADRFADERERIGLPARLKFHGLRHTAATLVAQGLPEHPNLVTALLGHADPRTSARYTRAARQRLDATKAIEAIPDLNLES